MISSPARVATARYKDAFESKIFAPAELRNVKHPPAGKRRDQRTSELFGTAVDDKDLRRQAPTFQPKVDPLSPRRRKLKFLQGGTVPEHNAVDIMNMPPHGHYRAEMLGFEEDTSGKIDPRSDPCVRRQQDLESYIFEEHENMNHADDILTKQRWNDKITPNSFNWYNSEPTLKGPAHDQPGTSHKDRAYHEKSSNVFDHRTVPQKTKEELQRVHNEEMQQEIDATLKRKANVYYSDLFNRPTPGYENQPAGDIIVDSRTSCGAGQGGGYLNHPDQQGSYRGYNMSGYYPRKMADDDSAITVNAEWTDARTEIMRHKAQQGRPMTAQERKFDELHQTNIPESPRHHALVPRPGPIETDTSQKVKRVRELFRNIESERERESKKMRAAHDDAPNMSDSKMIGVKSFTGNGESIPNQELINAQHAKKQAEYEGIPDSHRDAIEQHHKRDYSKVAESIFDDGKDNKGGTRHGEGKHRYLEYGKYSGYGRPSDQPPVSYSNRAIDHNHLLDNHLEKRVPDTGREHGKTSVIVTGVGGLNTHEPRNRTSAFTHKQNSALFKDTDKQIFFMEGRPEAYPFNKATPEPQGNRFVDPNGRNMHDVHIDAVSGCHMRGPHVTSKVDKIGEDGYAVYAGPKEYSSKEHVNTANSTTTNNNRDSYGRVERFRRDQEEDNTISAEYHKHARISNQEAGNYGHREVINRESQDFRHDLRPKMLPSTIGGGNRTSSNQGYQQKHILEQPQDFEQRMYAASGNPGCEIYPSRKEVDQQNRSLAVSRIFGSANQDIRGVNEEQELIRRYGSAGIPATIGGHVGPQNGNGGKDYSIVDIVSHSPGYVNFHRPNGSENLSLRDGMSPSQKLEYEEYQHRKLGQQQIEQQQGYDPHARGYQPHAAIGSQQATVGNQNGRDRINRRDQFINGVENPNYVPNKFQTSHQASFPSYAREEYEGEEKGYFRKFKKEHMQFDDNYRKTRDTPGELGMHVHQKHMKSSLVRDEFYERADKVKAWEVAEIALAAVPRTADERTVRDVCKGFECQLVKVHLDVDPISNLCKGRAKLVLRYNPDSNGLGGLIGKLQSLGWQVAFLDDN